MLLVASIYIYPFRGSSCAYSNGNIKKLLEIIYFISLSLKAVKKTLYSSVPRRPTKGISDEKFASEDCDTVFSSKNSNSVDLKEYKVFENNDHSKFRGTNLS